MSAQDRHTWRWLLHPYKIDVYLRTYFEQRPLHIHRANSEHYGELLTVVQLGNLIASGLFRHPSIRLVRDEVPLPPQSYIREISAPGGARVAAIDPQRVMSAYRDGCTVVCPAINRYWRPLALLCRGLEAESGYDVQANAYLTPPASVGFAPHWDSHDVLVVQLQGAKRWFVFDRPQRRLPLDDEVCRSAETTGEFTEIGLDQGDLLYVPRGHVHQAASLDSESLHVSITVKPPSWYDVLRTALDERVRSDPSLRAAAPFGYLNDQILEDGDAAAPTAAGLDLTNALRATADRFVLGRLTYPSGLFDLADRHVAGPLRPRPDLIFRVSEVGERVKLLFPGGGTLEFPAAFATALRYVAAAKHVTIDSVAAFLPPPEAEHLLAELVDHGLLVPVTGSEELGRVPP
ncbi:cupin domain-containing protein [Actinomadura alba]|uniref:JmjC domain-containing protein n=1 Tax=Actinomadura alba TaxID=406431 RepID=A0ABR7LSF7_9ACTN|nr:cupin domain-containing protein [Actinomadura alba]MBC6467762.1 hypothetical protein [Actinomadura alba]